MASLASISDKDILDLGKKANEKLAEGIRLVKEARDQMDALDKLVKKRIETAYNGRARAGDRE